MFSSLSYQYILFIERKWGHTGDISWSWTALVVGDAQPGTSRLEGLLDYVSRVMHKKKKTIGGV